MRKGPGPKDEELNYSAGLKQGGIRGCIIAGFIISIPISFLLTHRMGLSEAATIPVEVLGVTLIAPLISYPIYRLLYWLDTNT
jgi:hypothetical protein